MDNLAKRDPIAYYSKMIKTNPQDYRAYNNRGNEYDIGSLANCPKKPPSRDRFRKDGTALGHQIVVSTPSNESR